MIPFKESGFTLLEVIIVIGLVGFIYAVALPNFSLNTGSEVATKIGGLSEDIRSAFDYSVLTGKPLRMVFHLYSGDYWLETTENKNVKLGNDKINTDPRPEDEQQRLADFNEEFQKYEDLLGEVVKDSESDEDIPMDTPVIKAKEKLRGPTWHRLDSLEWQKRNLGEYLVIWKMKTEHLDRAMSIEDEGQGAFAMLYFLPQGYVEKAFMHIYFRKGEGEIDQDEAPYTLITHPYEGIAEVQVGLEEIDLESNK